MQMHGLDEKSNRQRVWVADARLNFSELLKEGQMSLERLRLREMEREREREREGGKDENEVLPVEQVDFCQA